MAVSPIEKSKKAGCDVNSRCMGIHRMSPEIHDALHQLPQAKSVCKHGG